MSARPLRLAALGLWHEANTFSGLTVSRDVLGAATLSGEAVRDAYRSSRTTMGGYLNAADDAAVLPAEVVPLGFTRLTPAGAIEEDGLQALLDTMRAQLEGRGPWDGVLLSIHGSAVATATRDVDGAILELVRSVVGPDVPIGASLDLHANVSALMAAQATVLNAMQTNPHVDGDQRGLLVARIVAAAARGECRPVMALRQLPAAINILRQNSSAEPMAALLAAAHEIEQRDGVLSASVLEGFPYADVEDLGMSVIVVTDDDAAAAERLADELAAVVWAARDEFDGTAPQAAEGVAMATTAEQPVLLLDVGDNIGGGTGGDSTVLVHELRRQRVDGVLSIMQDPAASARCHEAGVGATLELHVGGRSHPSFGGPMILRAAVEALHDGHFTDNTATHAGQSHYDTGPTALIRYDGDCLMVLTSRLEIPSSLRQLAALGVDPTRRAVIVAKGVQSPLVGYQPVCRTVIWVDTPGPTSADLTRFSYRHRRVPLYPFEQPSPFEQPNPSELGVAL